MPTPDEVTPGPTPSPAPVSPTPLLPQAPDGQTDPWLAAKLAEINAAMTGAGAASLAPKTLPELLADSAMAVTGRYGLTGDTFTGTMPPWAKDLSREALKHPDFDPYFGIVSEQGDERVFMGTEKVTKKVTKLPQGRGSEAWADEMQGDLKVAEPPEPRTETTTKTNDDTLTVTQVENLPYTWTEEEITSAMKRMREAGIPVTSFSGGEASLLNVWQTMVNRAAMTYSMSQGKNKVTPWDVLDMYKSEAEAAGTYTNFENGTRTTTTRSVANITEGEAWMSLQQTLSKMLGRDPSDQEVRDFSYKMNQLAAQNPSITKTITEYKAGEVTGQTNKTEGGFSAADMAQEAYEKAQNNPDYGAFQAASTYYNAALSALGPIGNV